MKSLMDLILLARNRYLDYRALDRIMRTSTFHDAYKQATKDQKAALETIVEGHSTLKLRRWIRDVLQANLELMSYNDLRDLAMIEQIRRYSRMTKPQLLRAIKERQNATKSLGKD